MHEWALAEGVLATSLQAIKESRGKSIKRITVVLGELQQVDRRIFIAAIKELSKGTAASEAKIILKREKVRLRCRSCGWKWSHRPTGREAELIHFFPEATHSYWRCEQCSSPDFSVEGGRGVWIESVEVE